MSLINRKRIQRIKSEINNLYDPFLIKHRRRTEIVKFQDAKRKKIVANSILTKEQEKKIDDFYLEHYGEKIPHTWHRYYTAYTGKFDYKYFPEFLYIPEFEHYMNLYPEYVEVFGDKNVIGYLANAVGIGYANTILSSCKGFVSDGKGVAVGLDNARYEIEKHDTLFIKPTIDTNSGIGCRCINVKDGIDSVSGDEFSDIIQSLGDDYIIQEKIKCLKAIEMLHPESCNTFRIISYRWKNEICICPAVMRIGRNSNYLDNAHAGGIFIGISDEGNLVDKAFSEFNEQFEKHPDTGITFKGYKIPEFPKVIRAARHMHSIMPQIGVINWDFTIDRSGAPMLIEANTKSGSIWLCQMAHGVSPFGEKTGEILEWLKFMKSIKASKRRENSFGCIQK